MTIARGQMKRQLYQDGTMPEGGLPSLEDIMEGKISPAEIALIKETLEDVDFMQEGYNLDRPNQAMGGLMNTRQAYGFGSIVKSITKPFKKAADAVGDVVSSIDMDDIDKIAQVASFIPGPHQPFAQAYTAGRGSGIGGGDFGGFQIGGFTPSGGMFGTTSTSGPSLSGFSLAPMEGPLPTGQSGGGGGGILDGIDPRILEAGMKIGTNILQNKAREKAEERQADEAYNVLKNNAMSLTEAQKVFGGAAVSAALAKLAYESQQQQLEDFKKDREAFERRREAKRAEYAEARRPEVTGTPTSPADVVRRPGQAMGGIMDVPLRTNPQGVTEMDFRETGGFVPPVGIKEKADDIPAMLSNNEFVFTADAVRAAGGGSVNKGAERMYSLMKKLEGQA
tara:strand:- start:287 stop:1468 length:1182 start_codon:yes stop_codon:yes gene_type:complete